MSSARLDSVSGSLKSSWKAAPTALLSTPRARRRAIQSPRTSRRCRKAQRASEVMGGPSRQVLLGVQSSTAIVAADCKELYNLQLSSRVHRLPRRGAEG